MNDIIYLMDLYSREIEEKNLELGTSDVYTRCTL